MSRWVNMNQIPKTRLELIMRLTGVTGKILSGHLHFDMSLISRWKNGKRRIINKEYKHAIAQFFIAYEGGKYKRVLTSLLELDEKAIESDVVVQLSEWIALPFNDKDMLVVDDAAGGASHVFLKSFEGNEGRRNGVLEFLKRASAFSVVGSRRLLLVSREDMSWLTEDKTFTVQWAKGLLECIEQGYEFIIIHTIQRSMDELYNAFIQWVPFYMTGKVRAFFMTNEQLPMSVQTLFMVDGLLLCEGNLHAGLIEKRYTALTNDLLTILNREQVFASLLDNATKLNSIYNLENMKTIMTSIVGAGANKEDSLFKADELFFTTMSRELLEDILDTNDVTLEIRKGILSFYDRLNENFDQNVRIFSNRHIYNLNKLIEQAEVSSFKTVLLSIMTGQEIWINKSQYISHVRSTIERLNNNVNYEIGLYLSESTKLPLEELDFWVKEGFFLAMWSKKSYEFIQMSNEPTMIETIKRFYKQLWSMIPLIDKDKTHVIEHLEKMIVIANESEK